MITFRKKSGPENLMPEAIEHLETEAVDFEIIKLAQADSVSKKNSRSMVLTEFIRNENGSYQITVMDKEFYTYTRKFLEQNCGMRILSEDKKARTRTAETDHLGIALDIIEVLGIKYNLSIVK